jgi:hypothetical protein
VTSYTITIHCRAARLSVLYKDFDIVLFVGELRVTMVGMKEDINVTVTLLGNNKYRCAYTPQHTGML